MGIVVYGQDTKADRATQALTTPFSIGKVFTFLFMTLGPLKIIAPFAAMTRGQDVAFKRQLALRGLIIATVAILAAATVGAGTLTSWGVSLAALQLAAGIVLFLVALEQVMEQFKPKKAEIVPASEKAQPHSVAGLAFSPLAFPTIVTPYGIAVLILLVTLRPDHLMEVFVVTVFVFILNWLAMLSADFILKSPLVVTGLGILGAVIGVLQIALGVQVIVDTLRDMRVV